MPLEGILNWWKNWYSKRVDDRMVEDAPPTPVIIVGTMGSAGQTIFGASATAGPTLTETNAATYLPTMDADTGHIKADVTYLRSRPTINSYLPDTVASSNQPRIGEYGDILLSGGAKANHKIVDKLSSYYGVVHVMGFWADTADTYTLAFQDEDDAACTGINAAFAIVVATGNTYFPLDLYFRGPTDNKDIEVDVAGGTGAEELQLVYEYWYET